MSVLATVAAALPQILGMLCNAVIIGQSIDQVKIAEQAAPYRAQLTKLAKQIAARIASNNTTLSRFQNAYATKNNELLSALYRGIGFGPRIDSITRMIKENEKELDDKTKQIGEENAELSKKAEEIAYNSANVGTTHAGNEAAGLEPVGWSKVKKWAGEKLNQAKDIIQNINGGMTNA